MTELPKSMIEAGYLLEKSDRSVHGYRLYWLIHEDAIGPDGMDYIQSIGGKTLFIRYLDGKAKVAFMLREEESHT